MASLWGLNGSASTDYSGQWKRVGAIPNPCMQAQTVDVDPPCDPALRKQCLPKQFLGYWNGLDSRKSTFTSQRSPSKRHYDLPDDGEPKTKRLLSERMAAGMRKLHISEDKHYGKSSTEHSDPSNGLWKDERVFGAGINLGNDPWTQEIDNRLDAKIDSDESGNEGDHPQLIIKQDFLNVFKSQRVEPTLPPQILSDIKKSSMQLVLWKPMPVLGVFEDKVKEEEELTASVTTGTSPNIEDDIMADLADEDMDL